MYTNKKFIFMRRKKGRVQVLQIDRISITSYNNTLNLKRYYNPFMYITDMKQMRHSYKCKKCSKIFNTLEACNRHENKRDELVRHTFPGGQYKGTDSIFKPIEALYFSLLKKDKTQILCHKFNPVINNEVDSIFLNVYLSFEDLSTITMLKKQSKQN